MAALAFSLLAERTSKSPPVSAKGRGDKDGAPSRFWPKALHYFGNVIVLEQPNAGDPGGPSFEAGTGICESDAAEREDRKFCFACPL